MNRDMSNLLAKLFGETNGHSTHPLDEWADWITNRHPELVDQIIAEIMSRTDLTDEDLPAAYMAAGAALSFASSQLFFDVVTGAIFGKDEEKYPVGEVLHNLEQIRARSHEFIDQTFDQYTKEFKEESEKEQSEEEDDDSGLEEYGSELDEEEDSELDDLDFDKEQEEEE